MLPSEKGLVGRVYAIPVLAQGIPSTMDLGSQVHGGGKVESLPRLHCNGRLDGGQLRLISTVRVHCLAYAEGVQWRPAFGRALAAVDSANCGWGGCRHHAVAPAFIAMFSRFE